MLNKILNRLLGAKKRYRKKMELDPSSELLPNFSISGAGSVTIGKENLLGAQIILENASAKVVIGNNVYIGNSKIIAKEGVVFGNDILVAWGVTFYDHDSHSLEIENRRHDIRQALKDFKDERGRYLANKNWETVNSKPIKIENDAWIGMESLILKGVTIGEGAIVAARSVVTKDVAPFTIVAGNPAKEVKKLK